MVDNVKKPLAGLLSDAGGQAPEGYRTLSPSAEVIGTITARPTDQKESAETESSASVQTDARPIARPEARPIDPTTNQPTQKTIATWTANGTTPSANQSAN